MDTSSNFLYYKIKNIFCQYITNPDTMFIMTTKITTSKKTLTEQPKQFVRIILTEDKPSSHRLVETADGQLEYRMGAGKREDMTPRSFRTLARTIVQAAKSHQLERIAIHLGTMGCPKLEAMGEDWFWRTLAENLTLASYEFTRYKSKKDDAKQLKEILVCGVMSTAAAAAFREGIIVGEAANTTRDIANQSANDMTPTALGNAAKAALKGTKATVKILNEAELKKLKMNLLLAVGGGTKIETKLIVIEYYGVGKGSVKKPAKPLVLIGKGITYDTGGLNVKPSGSMHDMHLDMSGGAAVIGAMQAIVKLGLKKNVIGIIPAAENAVSSEAMRAGDIVTAMNGKTVEILHTDAEGRLVLADAMTYSERFKPGTIIDVATLTGAALAALGQQASAFMTKDQALEAKLRALGEESGDLMWPLPLWDEYQSMIKSHRADISNIATNFSRFGGTIEGGIFLSHFAPKDVPWAHIDMAPRMDAIASDKLAKGATGEPVRLLVRFAEQY